MKKIFLIIFILIIITAAFLVLREREANVIFVGDMMFDRQIRKVMYKNGEDHVFSCIGEFLKKADLVVGNLEGPITENASISMLSKIDTPQNYTFTFPTNTASLLAKNNIKLVNLGNNHIGNFGEKGVASTKKILDEAEVDYFGGLRGDESVYRAQIAGHRISFISYNEFSSASEAGDDVNEISEKISEEKKNGQIVIVYSHWGNEYSPAPQRIKNTTEVFANPSTGEGADLIVGSHPHIILPSEKMGDTPVYYSLGNFIFDQYWNNEVSTGLVLEVSIKNKSLFSKETELNIIEHKVSILKDGRTCLIK